MIRTHPHHRHVQTGTGTPRTHVSSTRSAWFTRYDDTATIPPFFLWNNSCSNQVDIACLEVGCHVTYLGMFDLPVDTRFPATQKPEPRGALRTLRPYHRIRWSGKPQQLGSIAVRDTAKRRVRKDAHPWLDSRSSILHWWGSTGEPQHEIP